MILEAFYFFEDLLKSPLKSKDDDDGDNNTYMCSWCASWCSVRLVNSFKPHSYFLRHIALLPLRKLRSTEVIQRASGHYVSGGPGIHNQEARHRNLRLSESTA